MKITVYGAGYVGLITGVCLADLGNDVLIMDVNADRIALLKQSKPPFFEPQLAEYLTRNITANRIHFTTDIKEAVAFGLMQFIAVGTPSAADGSADLQYVLTVAEAIGQHINNYRIVINKSTVPIGTAKQVKIAIEQELNKRKVKVDFDIVSNPEFLRQGAAINDFMYPDRIVVGVDNERAAREMKQLYAPLNRDNDLLILMDVVSAEFTKYVANAYLATRISFINEMSRLAEKFGADIENIRHGIGTDKRIGPHFLFAGCGFGGSCFPKDVRALKTMAMAVNCTSNILDAVEMINEQQKRILFDKIARYFKGNLRNRVVAIWGLAFKPNTDDMRDASSRILIEALWQAGAVVQAYDPAAESMAKQIYGDRADLTLCANSAETLVNADVLAIVTEWDEFRNPDFAMIKKTLRYPAIFDGRNLYNPKQVASYGLQYYAIGRGDSLN